MTYRAWELKNLDRAALRELTAAIALCALIGRYNLQI